MSLLTSKELQQKLYSLSMRVADVNDTYHQWKILLESLESGEYKTTMKEHSQFWSMIERALRERWTLGIQRMFDEKRGVDNVERIVELCIFNKGLFRIESIRDGMTKGGVQENMVQQVLDNKKDPSNSDLVDLKASIMEVCPSAREIIKTVRDNWLSHENKEWSFEKVAAQYINLRRGDVEEILQRCWELSNVLSGALLRADSLRLEDLHECHRTLPEPWPMRHITESILKKANS